MEWQWIEKLNELSRKGSSYALVTVCQTQGSVPRGTGAKMIITPKEFFGTIGGGHLEAQVIEDARALLQNGESLTKRYPLGAALGQCCGGSVEILFEVLGKNPKLYLFGAGHVAQALCKTLVGTPFSVHLVDDREEWVHSDQLPSEIHRHCCSWDAFADEANWDNTSTYAAIMTYGHDLDQAIVSDLIRRPTKFLGLIGSNQKWKRFKARLSQRGFSDAELNTVTCPVGLPLGGKAPQEVAISIASQLLSLHYAN